MLLREDSVGLWYSVFFWSHACNFQVMAVTRSNICKNGMDSLSRGGAVIYYASVFLYFWVLSTPVVSLILGSYLYICINWLHIHFDEAFSSLRIANYKAFTRFHINIKGDLEVFTLAVDKVRYLYIPKIIWTDKISLPLPHSTEGTCGSWTFRQLPIFSWFISLTII